VRRSWGQGAPEWGVVNRPFSLVRGLVDGHIPDIPRHGWVLSCVEPASPRQQALRLLLHRMLKERAQLVVGWHPLGVVGSRSPSRRAVAVAMFWLARAKSRAPSSSTRILRFTLRAVVRARLPSLRCSISRSSSACSCSSWRHASSILFCRSLSCTSRTRGGAWFLSWAPVSGPFGGFHRGYFRRALRSGPPRSTPARGDGFSCWSQSRRLPPTPPRGGYGRTPKHSPFSPRIHHLRGANQSGMLRGDLHPLLHCASQSETLSGCSRP
jgi:hypothetical protein